MRIRHKTFVSLSTLFVMVTLLILGAAGPSGASTTKMYTLNEQSIANIISRALLCFRQQPPETSVITNDSYKMVLYYPGGQHSITSVQQPKPAPQITIQPRPTTKPVPLPQSKPNPQDQPQPKPIVKTPSKPKATVQGLQTDEQQMLNLVNTARINAGLKPLQVDLKLTKLARQKAQDMISKNYFSHTSPTYGSPFEMMKGAGVSYRYAGENLAGAPSVDIAHTNLMNSPGHRANILKPNYGKVGIGVVSGGPYGKMFVQLFTD